MTALVAVFDGCQGCGVCLLTCPERALRPAASGPVTLAELCTGCGECVEVCPVDAIALAPRDLTPDQPAGTGVPGNPGVGGERR